MTFYWMIVCQSMAETNE